MIFWQLNTRTPQTVDTLRAELEHERDHFLATQHPDKVVLELSSAVSAAQTSMLRAQLQKSLDAYLSAKPTGGQLARASIQMGGAIDGAIAMATSMTKGLRNALVRVTLSGHVDDERADGIEQRTSIAIDFAPMPRMSREASDELEQAAQ